MLFRNLFSHTSRCSCLQVRILNVHCNIPSQVHFYPYNPYKFQMHFSDLCTVKFCLEVSLSHGQILRGQLGNTHRWHLHNHFAKYSFAYIPAKLWTVMCKLLPLYFIFCPQFLPPVWISSTNHILYSTLLHLPPTPLPPDSSVLEDAGFELLHIMYSKMQPKKSETVIK